MTILAALIPAAVTIVGTMMMIGIAALLRARDRRKASRSPLTRDMLRPPGHSLRWKIEELDTDIISYLVVMTMSPLFIFAIHISQSYFAGDPETGLRLAISISFAVLLTAFAGLRLNRLLKERRTFVLGLDGELATGEELNQLMLDGCRVFHDIPFPYGNIDHVVVSRSGIYSVNTKIIGKPTSEEGNAEVTVDHRRNLICCHDRVWPIDVKQLEAEASWLSQELSSSVGRPLTAESILAVPGWFVKERIGRGSVYVINPRNPQKFFVRDRQVLSPELIQQVAHQLERLCRDVEPSYGEKKERWEDRHKSEALETG